MVGRAFTSSSGLDKEALQSCFAALLTYGTPLLFESAHFDGGSSKTAGTDAPQLIDVSVLLLLHADDLILMSISNKVCDNSFMC